MLTALTLYLPMWAQEQAIVSSPYVFPALWANVEYENMPSERALLEIDNPALAVILVNWHGDKPSYIECADGSKWPLDDMHRTYVCYQNVCNSPEIQ